MRISKAYLNQVAAYSNLNVYLAFSRGVSRGYETAGYPIVRLTNNYTGEVYKCSGGGYDMHGTNVGNFLKGLIHEEMAVRLALADYIYKEIKEDGTPPYGISLRDAEKLKDKEGKFIPSKAKKAILELNYYIDGACGESCMYRIAKGIGFDVNERYQRATTRKGTDKFLGVNFTVNPEGLLAKYLAKEKLNGKAES